MEKLKLLAETAIAAEENELETALVDAPVAQAPELEKGMKVMKVSVEAINLGNAGVNVNTQEVDVLAAPVVLALAAVTRHGIEPRRVVGGKIKSGGSPNADNKRRHADN